jgi:hypothetical protein
MASEFPNSGALFKADAAKKRENPKRPDYEGSAEVDGVDYWISAWLKEGKSGKFMSLAFKPKEQRKSNREPGDDVPW